MQAEDQGDTVTFMFESPNQDRISDFELKLMDIDSEQLGIPDTDYAATVKMPSGEFSRIVKYVPRPSLAIQHASLQAMSHPWKDERLVVYLLCSSVCLLNLHS